MTRPRCLKGIPDNSYLHFHPTHALMDIAQLKEKLGKHEAVEIIDVREREEFEAGDTIPGAVNVPMGKAFLEAAKGALPKDRKIVTVCKSGMRSGILARELKQKGYDIESLDGGIDAWKMGLGAK